MKPPVLPFMPLLMKGRPLCTEDNYFEGRTFVDKAASRVRFSIQSQLSSCANWDFLFSRYDIFKRRQQKLFWWPGKLWKNGESSYIETNASDVVQLHTSDPLGSGLWLCIDYTPLNFFLLNLSNTVVVLLIIQIMIIISQFSINFFHWYIIMRHFFLL